MVCPVDSVIVLLNVRICCINSEYPHKMASILSKQWNNVDGWRIRPSASLPSVVSVGHLHWGKMIKMKNKDRLNNRAQGNTISTIAFAYKSYIAIYFAFTIENFLILMASEVRARQDTTQEHHDGNGKEIQIPVAEGRGDSSRCSTWSLSNEQREKNKIHSTKKFSNVGTLIWHLSTSTMCRSREL